MAAVIPPVVRPARSDNPEVFPPQIHSRRPHQSHIEPRNGGVSEQVEVGKTILISGGTGTGKTRLLNIFAHSIPNHERVVTIEDTAELYIQKPKVVATECQTDTHKARVSFDDLLKGSLRWRPDRIILGEVLGTEARTLLDSFNTGHSGSLATIHANSATKALRPFANLVMRNHQQARIKDIGAEISEAVDLVIHIERQPGRRAVRGVVLLAATTVVFNSLSASKFIRPELESSHDPN